MVVVVAVLVVAGVMWLLLRGRPGPGGGPEPQMPVALPVGVPISEAQRPLGRVAVCGLSKQYGGVTVVDEVCFLAEPGRVTGLLGPNGAGKTTTLRMMVGLVRPSGGVARIGGRCYRDLERPVATVGALLEASGAHEGRTGRDHLRVMCQAAGLPLHRAQEVLDMVGLSLVGGRRVSEYSLGMRQRLGMAAALLGDPQVLILDEPGNGLDPAGIRWTRDLLLALAASGRTVLVSSHQLAEIEQVADDLVVIAAGRVVARGTLESVIGAHGGLEEAFLELTEGKGDIR
jgi:ABC-2 type transport system ATP-binding protein